MQNEYALVSIIIPTFKRNERLESAINSCLTQSYKNLEIIIVDDNGVGTEYQIKTKSKIDNFIKRVDSQRIKYIHNTMNMGGAVARNIGVANSNGKYIAFLDDDDLLHQDSIKLRLDAIAEHEVDFCVSDMNIIDENENFVESDSTSFCGANLIDFILDGNFYTPMLLIKKEKFMQAGGFTDTPRFQDHLLMIKLLSNNISHHHLKKRLFDHIRHTDERISTAKVDNFERGWLNRIELEKKFLHLLDNKQKRKVKFRWYDNSAIASVIGGNKVNASRYIMKMIQNIYSVSCIKRVSIMTVRLMIAKNIHEKLRCAFKGY